MSSITYTTYTTSRQVNSSDLAAEWVETLSTRRILDQIRDPIDRNTFMTTVASLAQNGLGPAEIEEYYVTRSMEDISLPTRSQRSSDSRQAGPARQIGANEGRRHDDGNSYARRRGSEWDYTGHPGLQVTDPRSTTGTHHRPERSFDSGYGHAGQYPSSSYGYSTNHTTSYGAGATPSGNRFSGDFALYGSDREYSSGSDWSGPTLFPSDSVSQQGRASRGYEQDRRNSRRAYR